MRAVLALLLLLATPATAAVTLSLSPAEVPSGQGTATVCVSLATGGAEVAGTQNDLVWDGDCATLRDSDSCYAAGTHNKDLFGKFLDNRDFTYRALILALGDVDPIDDGVLYCCDFDVALNGGACCPIGLTGAGASDSRGNSVAVDAQGAEICAGPIVEGSFTPTPISEVSPTPTVTARITGEPDETQTATRSATRTWTPTQCSSGCGGGGSDEDDGCQVADPSRGGAAVWPLAIAAAILALRRRA